MDISDCLHFLPKFLCRQCSIDFFGPIPARKPVEPVARPFRLPRGQVTGSMSNIPRQKRVIERYRSKGN